MFHKNLRQKSEIKLLEKNSSLVYYQTLIFLQRRIDLLPRLKLIGMMSEHVRLDVLHAEKFRADKTLYASG